MNKMKKILPGLAVISLFACSGQGNHLIQGKISGAEGKTVYLERLVNNRWGRTDSTVIGSDGKFVLVPAHALELDYYRVALSPEDIVVIITDSTESVEISGTAGSLFKEARVKGSEYTALLRDFQEDVEKLQKEEEKALAAFQTESSPEAQAQWREKIIDTRKLKSDKVKTWLQSNSKTPAALAALEHLDMKADLKLYRSVLDDTAPVLGHSMLHKLMKQQADRMALKANAPGGDETPPGAKIAVGRPAPEIALPDPGGKVRKLSDLRGKVVLVDFWASWCGPCRRENPNVVEVYKKYKKDGFEVFSVSLDKSADPWKQAIGQDKLTWANHVSDLKFWQSQAAQDYGVHSIPFPVLLDREGKVIAFGNNIRGPLLESNLQQIFGR